MDKGEPSLVPQWLRNSGHASGGGNSNHLHLSDSASLLHNSRNRNSRSKSDVDSIHSPFLDRSSSTNSRRGSSNGSAKHAYSSFNFNRSQRDKDRSREKDRPNYDPWDLDPSIPLRNILTGRDQDPLRRSHSMVTRRQGDHLSRGITVGLKNGGSSSSSYNGNGILSGSSTGNSFQRTGFDKEFPSLGAEEKHGGQDVTRVSSPGLSSAVQSLPGGNVDNWTSCLAAVPNVSEKAGAGPGSLTSPKANVVSTGTLTGPTGLNMAEALVQAPSRTNTPPQGSVKTQRSEDLAIKQSRQLIPVVPSAPKCSTLNHLSDKSKSKQVVRTGETGLAPSRNAQQHSSALLGNSQSNPSGQIKSEKKLLVLNFSNGVTAGKDTGSPSGNTNSRPASSQLMTVSQSTQSAPARSTNSPKGLKGPTTSTMIPGQTTEKKSSLAQAQSRHAFYSALKQKTTSTSITTDPVNSSSVEEKLINNSSKELVASDPSSPQATNGLEGAERIHIATGFEAADTPDEKEAEFLKSLGWDENCGDEALTEEEINAFLEQYKNQIPSLPQKLSIIHEAREDVA